jgi:hypothetical protein
MEEASYTRLEAEEADQVIAPDAMLVVGYDAQGFVAQIGSWYLSNLCLHGVACDSSPFSFPLPSRWSIRDILETNMRRVLPVYNFKPP